MKFSRVLLAALITTSLSPFVNAYQFEASAGYRDYYDSLITAADLRAAYYFSQVMTDSKPLGEAAFLGKSSSVELSYSHFDTNYAGSSDSKQISVSYFIPHSIFFTELFYDDNVNGNYAVLRLGISPIEGLLITTYHNNEADDYNANLYAKYVFLLNSNRAINIESAFAKNEETNKNEYNFRGDFYFNRQFSLGASFSNDDTGDYYSLMAQHFFLENAAIETTYSYIDNNKDYDQLYDNFSSRNIWSVTLSARF
jgi:hypothetical protein